MVFEFFAFHIFCSNAKTKGRFFIRSMADICTAHGQPLVPEQFIYRIRESGANGWALPVKDIIVTNCDVHFFFLT